MSNDTQFRTTDGLLAAYLIYAGYHLARVEFLGRGDATFIFDVASLDLADDLEDFGNDRAVGAKTFCRAITYIWSCKNKARDRMGEFRPQAEGFVFQFDAAPASHLA